MSNPLYILGLNFGSYDPAACLLKDGEIVAMAEEERFTRIKHAFKDFPINAVKFCLKYENIILDEVESMAFGFDAEKHDSGYMKKFYDNLKYKKDERTLEWEKDNIKFFSSENIIRLIGKNLGNRIPEVRFIPHHLAHAYSAYFLSGFKKTDIVTMDGSGEENCTVLWTAENENIKKIKSFDIPHSLGWFYATFTEFLGFKAYDGEGKVMGLAPYGKPNNEIKNKLSEVIKITDDGYSLNPYYIFYGKHTYGERYTNKLIDLFGQEPRKKDGNITEFHKNLAFGVQEVLEKIAQQFIRNETLCLAGGVALNCKMNGKILYDERIKDLFIQPVSSDAGVALGSALVAHKQITGTLPVKKLKHVYFGPEYSNDEIARILKVCKIKHEYHEDIEMVTAQYLAEGKIVGWFQGRMECGPRALGGRSILADPRNPKMKDIINENVKHRENWRPFCPSILYEEKENYLIQAYGSPFMILSFKIKTEKIKEIPSVVHIDGTARPQTVEKDVNPRYWKLIKYFQEITGVPVLLNTSFNIRGEPIVCSPEDAIRCFFSTGMDILILGNYLIKKAR